MLSDRSNILTQENILGTKYPVMFPQLTTMGSSFGLIQELGVILLLLISLSDDGRAQNDYGGFSCDYSANYTANSTYRANLNEALGALASNTSQYGFYSATVGQGQDTANAVVLCLAYLQTPQCHSCLKNATADLLRRCPNQIEAIMWYSGGMCTLRYSNQTLTGLPIPARDVGYHLVNTQPVDDLTLFQQIRTQLLDVLRPIAANGSLSLKVSAGNKKSGFISVTVLSGLLQCIPTLTPDECNACLITASKLLSNSSKGGRVLQVSCYIRYEIYPIVNQTRLQELNISIVNVTDSPPGATVPNSPPPDVSNLPPATTTPRLPPETKSDNSVIKIVLPIPIVVGIILVACAAIFFTRSRRKKLMKKQLLQPIQKNGEDISSVDSLQYEFHQIRVATNDFSDANKLGRGGFGAVYRGELSDGQEIAVKRLSRGSGQGDTEFKNEVLLVAKLQHRNLVRLLGFASEGSERLLMYEFVPNSSLDHFLFDSVKCKHLNWETRNKIIGGIARGLLYLHEDSRLRIIHRDLKASNILLDEEMNPKIADFGMARLFGQNEIQGNTNTIVGTYGYMSPEYAIYGQFSVKSDVFSFGVLILEILSGQKIMTNTGEGMKDLLTIVWENWSEGTIESVVDPVIRTERDLEQDILRIIHIGLLCVQENPNDRPTMSLVVLMLSSSTLKLAVPSQPAFLLLSRFGPNNIPTFVGHSSSGCSEFNQGSTGKANIHDASSQNSETITELHPR